MSHKAPLTAKQQTCVERIASRILRKYKGHDLDVAKDVVTIVLEENLKAVRRIDRGDKEKVSA